MPLAPTLNASVRAATDAQAVNVKTHIKDYDLAISVLSMSRG